MASPIPSKATRPRRGGPTTGAWTSWCSSATASPSSDDCTRLSGVPDVVVGEEYLADPVGDGVLRHGCPPLDRTRSVYGGDARLPPLAPRPGLHQRCGRAHRWSGSDLGPHPQVGRVVAHCPLARRVPGQHRDGGAQRAVSGHPGVGVVGAAAAAVRVGGVGLVGESARCRLIHVLLLNDQDLANNTSTPNPSRAYCKGGVSRG